MVLETNNKAKRPQANIRRNSTGNILDFNAKSPQVLPLPIYLRASMGSCHDFCKYGLKPEFTQTPTTSSPLPKKPPVLPNKSQNVVNVIKNSTSSVTTTIQQKMKQKGMIPKHPNDVKLKSLAKGVSSSILPVQPLSRRRRYSDVYAQTQSIKNGSNYKVAVCVPVSDSLSGKRGDSRNASKDLSQSKNKSHKARTKPSFEIPVEKILYIDEMAPCKEADDHSLIQKLSSEETNDKAIDLIDDRFSSSLSLSEDNINSGSTTGSSCSDTLASFSITSFETESDNSSNMFKSKKGSYVDNASISTDSDISSNTFESKKVISVDDDCKSIETKNESMHQVVAVLQHQNQNQEEQKLVSENLSIDVNEETARNLVEAGKVKALVSAFEAVISFEDNKKSLRTLKA